MPIQQISLRLYITDHQTSFKTISCSVITNRHGALYGTAFPFQAEQSNVFILLGMYFSMYSKGKKNPLTYKPKNMGELCMFFKNT